MLHSTAAYKSNPLRHIGNISWYQYKGTSKQILMKTATTFCNIVHWSFNPGQEATA